MQKSKDNSGATAIEYGLIAALIATVIVVALQFVGAQMSSTYSHIGTAVGSATSASL